MIAWIKGRIFNKIVQKLYPIRRSINTTIYTCFTSAGSRSISIHLIIMGLLATGHRPWQLQEPVHDISKYLAAGLIQKVFTTLLSNYKQCLALFNIAQHVQHFFGLFSVNCSLPSRIQGFLEQTCHICFTWVGQKILRTQ